MHIALFALVALAPGSVARWDASPARGARRAGPRAPARPAARSIIAPGLTLAAAADGARADQRGGGGGGGGGGRRRASVAMSNVAIPLGGDGGDGGGGGGARAGKGDGDRGDGDDARSVEQVLSDGGMSRDELPADVLAALSTGALSSAELGNYLTVLRNPVLRLIASSSAFLRNKLIASPHLGTVIGVETAVGLATMSIAECNARAGKLLAEADFILCDLALVVATNIALVVTLSPTVAIGAAAPRGLRAALAGLPNTFLQPGQFSLAQRVGCYAANGVQFGVIGVCSSTVGTLATKGLISLRERVTRHRPDVQLAPLAQTALAYGAFVGVSSSTRYQLVNAVETSVFARLPVGVPIGALSTVLRTANNYLGGVTWISFQRTFQRPERPPPPPDR
jgi:hypothetical protein